MELSLKLNYTWQESSDVPANPQTLLPRIWFWILHTGSLFCLIIWKVVGFIFSLSKYCRRSILLTSLRVEETSNVLWSSLTRAWLLYEYTHKLHTHNNYHGVNFHASFVHQYQIKSVLPFFFSTESILFILSIEEPPQRFNITLGTVPWHQKKGEREMKAVEW